jgi:hypothetical protein
LRIVATYTVENGSHEKTLEPGTVYRWSKLKPQKEKTFSSVSVGKHAIFEVHSTLSTQFQPILLPKGCNYYNSSNIFVHFCHFSFASLHKKVTSPADRLRMIPHRPVTEPTEPRIPSSSRTSQWTLPRTARPSGVGSCASAA